MPYAAVVLSGSYDEAGDGGRHRSLAGEVRIHPPFTLHSDQIGQQGATIVNLKLSLDEALSLRDGLVSNPEELVAAATDKDFDIGSYLQHAAPECEPTRDLPDLLAERLDQPGDVRLERWADAHGVSARTVRRQFVQAIGMTPAHYRWRAKTRGAWKDVMSGLTGLAAIAADWGFSDQAHFTRSIRLLTGFPPQWWRRDAAKEGMSV
jgi:AraC-like DNA-binding protein